MTFQDNYAIQAEQARKKFLEYDQEILAAKLHTILDEEKLYVDFLGEKHSIDRKTGRILRFHRGTWIPADSFAETMTLYDLVCDCKEERYISGQWKNTRDFGMQFHQSLLENVQDPWAQKFQEDMDRFHRSCLAMGGVRYPYGDASYAIPIFESLALLVQFWRGDDEFPPSLRWLWDQNAKMYLRYETMFYAIGLVKTRFSDFL